jgi:hypothetical protein
LHKGADTKAKFLVGQSLPAPQQSWRSLLVSTAIASKLRQNRFLVQSDKLKSVLGLFIYTLPWVGHMDQVGSGDGRKFHLLRLRANALGPREGRQLHRPS